ncbi:MAG: hypothetical protein ACI4M3_04170 [Acutalibacteraceae bacterium]
MRNDVKKINRAIKKAKRELERKHEGEFMPYRASLRLMCEKYAIPEYFNAIRNRIYREAEKNDILNDYLYISLDNLEDIYFDSTGIVALWDILKGYFDEDFLRNFRRWLSAVNKEEEYYFNFAKAVKTAKISQLTDLKQAYEKYNEVNNTDLCGRALTIVQAEIDRRKCSKS